MPRRSRHQWLAQRPHTAWKTDRLELLAELSRQGYPEKPGRTRRGVGCHRSSVCSQRTSTQQNREVHLQPARDSATFSRASSRNATTTADIQQWPQSIWRKYIHWPDCLRSQQTEGESAVNRSGLQTYSLQNNRQERAETDSHNEQADVGEEEDICARAGHNLGKGWPREAHVSLSRCTPAEAIDGDVTLCSGQL